MYFYVLNTIYNQKHVFKIGTTEEILTKTFDYVCYFKLHNITSKDDLLKLEQKVHEYLADRYIYIEDDEIDFYEFNTTEYLYEIITHVLLLEGIEFNQIENKSLQMLHYETIKFSDELGLLRPYQVNCIKAMNETKEKANQVIMSVGTGKTRIIKHHAESFIMENPNAKILILVPTLIIAEQFSEIITGNVLNSEHDHEFLMKFNKGIIISTYQSSILLKDKAIKFDVIYFDEAHITCGAEEDDKSEIDDRMDIDPTETQISPFKVFLNEDCIKFFFTATPKDNILFGMSNTEIYGEVIYEYSLRKAIQDNYLTDYRVDLILADENSDEKCLDYVIDTKRHKKIFIYSSSLDNAKKCHEYLLSKKIKSYYMDGTTNKANRKKIFDEFSSNAELSCMNLCQLGKLGLNIPCIDSVVLLDCGFSAIDIIQRLGRALRLYNEKSMAYIYFVLPENENKINRIKDILYHLGNHDSVFKERIKTFRRSKGGFISYKNLKKDIDKKGEIEIRETIYDRFMNIIEGLICGNINII